MKTTSKLLTLAAAALAAALPVSTAEAACRVAVGVRVGPPFPHVRAGVVVRPAAPYRVVRGVRFYSAFPGPGYVYVGGGWTLPPRAGAVWVPAHYNRHGVWIPGHWRA